MMEKQMELFEEGGLKDEGGMIDEESGNEVPVGGTRKGVRDDIPANISEGEFIFPEDVTRYIGLDKLMQMRQEAKMGLKRMEAMGQMGNSDEATIDDDLPFGMADLIIVGAGPEDSEELNMAEGGLTTTATGSGRTVTQTVPTQTTPVTTGQTITRRLTPEPTAVTNAPVNFKKLMGDASIEYKEYRNAAGESMMIPIVGGVPQFPVPEGYTLYTGTDAVENTNTTAGAIVRAANTATAEARAASMGSDNDTPPPMPTAKAINWSGLSTKELIERSAELTGTGSTIAKGAMVFLGPIGAIGYAMMRHQEKKVAAEIASRLAKGGLTAAQRKSLTETQEKLAPAKVTTLFGKVIEFVGSALGLTSGDVEKAKENTSKIETYTQTPQSFNLGDVGGQYSTSPVLGDLPAASVDTSSLAGVTAASGLGSGLGSTYDEVPVPASDNKTPLRTDMQVIADATKIASSLDFKQGEDTIMQQPVVSREQIYASDTNQQPVFDQPVVAEPSRSDQIYAATLERIKNTEQNNVARIKDPRLKEESTGYNRPLPDGTDNFFNQDIDMGAAGYGSQPQPLQIPTAFDPSGGNYAVTPQQVAYSTSVSQSNEDKYDPRGILPTSEQVQLEKFPVPPSPVTSQDLRPKTAGVSTVEKFPVPPSPVTNLDLRPETAIASQIEAQRAAQAGPEVPGGTLPIGVQTQQAFNFNAEDTAMSMPVTPAVSTYDTVPSKLSGVPGVPTDRFDTKGLTPAPQTQQAFNLGSAEGQLSTSPVLSDSPTPSVNTPRTFNEEFAFQRKAGAKEFSYDRDGDGKTERYTTQTVEEAAPAGTNTFVQSAKNLLTPFDNKEYVGGKLVTTKNDRDTSKSTSKAKAPSAKVKNQVATSSGNKVTVETKPSSNKTEGAVSAGGQYAGDGFEWVAKKNEDGTPALNKNGGKQLTRTYTGVNKNATGSNDTSSASSSDNDKSIVCTEMYRQTQLADWQQAMKIWHVYQEKHLTMYHQVGYHWLFQPYVKGMKNSSILTKIGSKLAKHRTQHLRHILTKGKAKDDLLGNVWCKFIHPLVYVAGVIKEKIGK